MTNKRLGTLATLLSITLLTLAPAAAASEDQPVDVTLPEYGGYPAPDLKPWGGLVGDPGARVLIDDFNRADGPLGANWTVQTGSFAIFNQAARGGPFALATHNSATGDTVDMDVIHDGTNSTQYAAAILNYGGGSTNLFIKVQDNGGLGQFTRLFCYTGNNGGAFYPYQDLGTQFSTAHMTVTVDAARNVAIDFTSVNGGALPDQHYDCPGAPAPEGPAIGMAAYTNRVLIDNFGNTPIPVELMTFSVE